MKPEVVHPGYDIDRGYPNGYRPRDARHFEDSRFARIPAITRRRLHDAHVVGSTLFEGYRLAEELCRSKAAPALRGGERLKIYVKRLFLPARRVATAVWALDHWSKGYFHWLVDVLPRLLAVDRSAADAPVLLPAWYRSREYVAESLELLGKEVLSYGARQRVAVDELFTTTYPRSCDFNAPSVRSVGRWFRDREAPGAASAGTRIYISRKRAARRRIQNEPQVEALLRRRGFRCLVFDDLPFREQRELMYGAGHLVSNHGAGLTNMIFMPPGAQVLELKSESRNVNNCFFHLAEAYDHHYWYEMFEGDDPDVQRANIFVDLDRLDARLDAVLGADG